MVIVTTAGEDVCNYIAGAWESAEYGSGTTLETESDSSLVTPVVASLATISNTRTGLSLSMVHEIASTTANSTTLAEYALFDGSTLRTRVTTTPLSKDSTLELQTTTILFLDIN